MVKSLHGEVSPGASEDSSSVLAPVGTTCLEDAARIECVCVCLGTKIDIPRSAAVHEGPGHDGEPGGAQGM